MLTYVQKYNFSEYFAIFKPCNCSQKLFSPQSSPSCSFSISTFRPNSASVAIFVIFSPTSFRVFISISSEMTCWGDVGRCREVFLKRLLVTVSDSQSPSHVEVLSLVTFRGGLSCTCYNPQLVTQARPGRRAI